MFTHYAFLRKFLYQCLNPILYQPGLITFGTWTLPQEYEVRVEGTVAGTPQAIVYY